ncbi:MAG: hypothetical protein ACR2J8_11640, partial [Thermomicrobiales bacterium]
YAVPVDRRDRPGKERIMMGTTTRVHRHLAAAALFGALALGMAPANSALGHAAHGHPAKIHNGSCEDLKGVAFELNGVGAEVDEDGNALPETTVVNEKSSYQVLQSTTAIEASIDDLLADPRAIKFYENDETLDAIACGNLGGARFGNELAVGLAEANVPGHTGIAVISEDPAKPGESTVTVYIGHGLSPVSMSGMAGGHDDAEMSGDQHDHADAEATPSA